MNEQYGRIISAIEYTLHQMRDLGPRPRGDAEDMTTYQRRVENWYRHKQEFVLFAIKCVRETDKRKASEYLIELRKITDRL